MYIYTKTIKFKDLKITTMMISSHRQFVARRFVSSTIQRVNVYKSAALPQYTVFAVHTCSQYPKLQHIFYLYYT